MEKNSKLEETGKSLSKLKVTTEEALASQVQNIGEILKTTDSKTAFSRSSPFGKDEMEKIIDLLGQLDLVTEKNDRELILASFEELLELFQLPNVFPRIKVVGLEGSGKSTIVEALLGLAVNYSDSARATRCPVVYRIRKNGKLGSEYRVTLSYKDEYYEQIEMDQLASKVKAFMNSLRDAKVNLTADPLFVAIECRADKTRSSIVVDAPGCFDGTDPMEPSVQLAKRLAWDNSSFDLLIVCHKTTQELPKLNLYEQLELGKLDPNLQRSYLVHTNMDSYELMCDNEKKSRKNVRECFDAWEKSFGNNVPFRFALHSLSENEMKKDFHSRTAAINAHIGARQKSMQMWMKGKFPESDFSNDPKYNIDTLKDSLAVKRLETLENNTKSLKRQFIERREQLRQKIMEKERELVVAESRTIDMVLLKLIKDFGDEFKSLFQGEFSSTAQANFRTDQLKDLRQEHSSLKAKGVDPSKWPGTGLIHNTFVMGAEPDEELLYAAVQGAEIKQGVAAHRLDRLRNYLRIKISATEVEVPSQEQFYKYCVRTTHQDALNLNASAAQLASNAAQELFANRGTDYIRDLLEPLLVSHAEHVLEILGHRQENYFLSNTFFSSLFLSFVKEVLVGQILQSVVTDLKTFSGYLMGSIRFSAPKEMEQMAHFISGPLEGDDDLKIERYSQKERIAHLGNGMKVHEFESIKSPVSGLLEHHYRDASVIFKRQFSVLREQYAWAVSAVLDGGLMQKFLGPPKVEVFSDFLVDHILLKSEGTVKAAKRKTEQELLSEFMWDNTAVLNSMRNNISQLKDELVLVEAVAKKLNSVLDKMLNKMTSKPNSSSGNMNSPSLSTSAHTQNQTN